jgi:hypothetical protein
MLSTQEIKSKYGEPDEKGGYLTTITLPYPMRLAWDLNSKVTKMRCHKLVADKFKAIFADLLTTYGLPKIQELGIDLFGGCFNYRAMRGGSDWSRHSWGIAIDLDPTRNDLKTHWDACQFSKPEYKKMIEIFYKHGFVSLGLEKGYDGMHLETKD